mmetsp:Transcript_28725/g.89620  ORF Transcript_28725/g.89620 Transcript_28725/m.89620 type:complete len:574 (-) Transcript_28725:420-2141(-)
MRGDVDLAPEEGLGLVRVDRARDGLRVCDEADRGLARPLPEPGPPLRLAQAQPPHKVVEDPDLALLYAASAERGQAAERLPVELLALLGQALDDVAHLLDRRPHRVDAAGAQREPALKVALGVHGTDVHARRRLHGRRHAGGAGRALRAFELDLVVLVLVLLGLLHRSVHLDALGVHLPEAAVPVLLQDGLAPEALRPLAALARLLHPLQAEGRAQPLREARRAQALGDRRRPLQRADLRARGRHLGRWVQRASSQKVVEASERRAAVLLGQEGLRPGRPLCGLQAQRVDQRGRRVALPLRGHGQGRAGPLAKVLGEGQELHLQVRGPVRSVGPPWHQGHHPRRRVLPGAVPRDHDSALRNHGLDERLERAVRSRIALVRGHDLRLPRAVLRPHRVRRRKPQGRERALAGVHQRCLVVLGHRHDAGAVLVALDPVLLLHLLAVRVVRQVVRALREHAVLLHVLGRHRSRQLRPLLERREGDPYCPGVDAHVDLEIRGHDQLEPDLGALLHGLHAEAAGASQGLQRQELHLRAGPPEHRPDPRLRRADQGDQELGAGHLQSLRALHEVLVAERR